MLIGPPVVAFVANACGTPGGYMSGSRVSAMFLTGVIGNGFGSALSGYEVPECRWRNAVIDATGSRTLIFTTSAPGCDPAEVTFLQSIFESLLRAPVSMKRSTSALRSLHVSSDANTGIPSLPAIQAALSA